MKSEKFSKDFACNHRKYLPFQFGYLDGNVYKCSYHRLWVLAAWINNDHSTAATLLNQACPPIKREAKFSEFLRNLHQHYAENVIENAKIGDIVFCFDEIDGEVVLLEKPTTL